MHFDARSVVVLAAVGPNGLHFNINGLRMLSYEFGRTSDVASVSNWARATKHKPSPAIPPIPPIEDAACTPQTLVFRTTYQWVGWLPGALLFTDRIKFAGWCRPLRPWSMRASGSQPPNPLISFSQNLILGGSKRPFPPGHPAIEVGASPPGTMPAAGWSVFGVELGLACSIVVCG